MSSPPPTNITDFVSVSQRVEQLGLASPNGIAFLPDDFESAETTADFRQRPEAATLRKVLKQANVAIDDLSPGVKLPYIVNRSSQWIAPTLFISSSLLSTDPTMVSVALNVLSNYVTDFLKGFPGGPAVKFEIVVEKKGDRSCKRITYQGDAAGIASLAEVVGRIADE